MTPPKKIADSLLSSHSGRIAVANLLAGHREKHISSDLLTAVLWWWGEWVVQMNVKGVEIGPSLSVLINLCRDPLPPEYKRPVCDLPDPHITNRQGGGLNDGETGGSVRETASMLRWMKSDDRRALARRGIDLTSTPGHLTFGTAFSGDPKILNRAVALEAGKKLTNALLGSKAILFYTSGAMLADTINKVGFARRADQARDYLGLAHYKRGTWLTAVYFPRDWVENRTDKGRPTAMDARGNVRFQSESADLMYAPGWGRTADLASLSQKALGLPERVCGEMPETNPADLEVQVSILGTIVIPRGDLPGVLDDDFATLLETRAVHLDKCSLSTSILNHLT